MASLALCLQLHSEGLMADDLAEGFHPFLSQEVVQAKAAVGFFQSTTWNI